MRLGVVGGVNDRGRPRCGVWERDAGGVERSNHAQPSPEAGIRPASQITIQDWNESVDTAEAANDWVVGGATASPLPAEVERPGGVEGPNGTSAPTLSFAIAARKSLASPFPEQPPA